MKRITSQALNYTALFGILAGLMYFGYLAAMEVSK